MTDDRTPDFSRDQVTGATGNAIVRSVLEHCGYKVYPFGHESTFSSLKQHLRELRLSVRSRELEYRIRSMPDLIVEAKDELWLTEVKFRTNKDLPGRGQAVRFRNWEILKCRQYWSEALMVLLTPYGERFYAKRMADFEVDPQNTNADTWFTFDTFKDLPTFFPATTGKLAPFRVAVDNLANLWRTTLNAKPLAVVPRGAS